jgi:hypothetical protein
MDQVQSVLAMIARHGPACVSLYYAPCGHAEVCARGATTRVIGQSAIAKQNCAGGASGGATDLMIIAIAEVRKTGEARYNVSHGCNVSLARLRCRNDGQKGRAHRGCRRSQMRFCWNGCSKAQERTGQ